MDLLALHVVLDYIDEPRLGALQRDRKGEGSVVTTLLQARPCTRCRAAGVPPRSASTPGTAGAPCSPPPRPGGLGRNATVEKQVTAKPYSVAVEIDLRARLGSLRFSRRHSLSEVGSRIQGSDCQCIQYDQRRS